jgi:hypothetical protein
MGGLAVRIHGIPRPTYDVDLTILADRSSLKEMFEAAETANYVVDDIYKSGWVDRVADMPIVKLQAWLQDGKAVDVDVFIAESDFQASLMRRRMPCDFDSRILWVVSPEDLILLKLLANRPRDIGDVQDVMFMQGQLDESYMREWADVLQIRGRLETAFAEALK